MDYYWAIYRRLLGLYSLSGRTSYRKISWSLEALRLDVVYEENSPVTSEFLTQLE